MKLNLGNIVIDLNSPTTLVVFLVLLFSAMILASYAGQSVKKFVRTKSGRLTTKRPTPKMRAKKSVQSSSLVPMSLQNKLKKAKVIKSSKYTKSSKLSKLTTTSKVVKKPKKPKKPKRSISSSSVTGRSSSSVRHVSDSDFGDKPYKESYDLY